MSEVVHFPSNIDVSSVDASVREQAMEAGFTPEDIAASSARRRENVARLQSLFVSLPD